MIRAAGDNSREAISGCRKQRFKFLQAATSCHPSQGRAEAISRPAEPAPQLHCAGNAQRRPCCTMVLYTTTPLTDCCACAAQDKAALVPAAHLTCCSGLRFMRAMASSSSCSWREAPTAAWQEAAGAGAAEACRLRAAQECHSSQSPPPPPLRCTLMNTQQCRWGARVISRTRCNSKPACKTLAAVLQFKYS